MPLSSLSSLRVIIPKKCRRYKLCYREKSHRQLPHIVKFSGGRSSGMLLRALPFNLNRSIKDIEYTKLNEEKYSQVCKYLIDGKGTDQQQNFLQQVRNSSSFIHWVENEIGIVEGNSLPLGPEKLREQKFQNPPPEMEQQLYEQWQDLDPGTARQPNFWGAVTLAHIKGAIIESTFLAADGSKSGAQQIDWVLSEGTEEDIDKCVRTVLRRLSGLREARGNRSVYVDCLFGRAWWRERLATKIERLIAGELNHLVSSNLNIRRTLHMNQSYWERLVSPIVSAHSNFGSINLRDIFVIALSQRLTRNNSNPDLKDNDFVSQALKNLETISTSRKLGLLENEELLSIITDLIKDCEKNYRKKNYKESNNSDE